MTIQEAAEKYYPKTEGPLELKRIGWRALYVSSVQDYLSLMKAAGYEWYRAVDIKMKYLDWLRETERTGSVITGKSMEDFFEYLNRRT